jgi:hypothetical protein
LIYISGCKIFIPAFLGTVAAVCGTAANLYCQSVSFPQSTSDGSLDVSPFYYRTKDIVEVFDEQWVVTTCRNYRYLDRELGFDYDLDSKAKTVRAFAIMTPVIGGLGLVYAYLAPCLQTSPAKWKAMMPIFLIACLFQGITLLILESSICTNNPVVQYLEEENPVVAETLQEGCEKGTGYILNIIGVVFWFLAGISFLVIPAPSSDGREPVQTQTVTYQQNTDGTVEETNVTVVKGANVATEATPETAK